jgi:hypothetical protein
VPTPGNPQSLNRYSYVENNPVKWTDPSGHFLGVLVGLVVALIAYDAMIAIPALAAYAFTTAAILGGAIAGGIGAAMNGGNVGLGVAMGAAFGGLGALAGPALLSAYAPLGEFGASVATGATLGAAFGAAGAAIHGGNVLQGALTGAISGAVVAAVAYGVSYVQAKSPAVATVAESDAVGILQEQSSSGGVVDSSASIHESDWESLQAINWKRPLDPGQDNLEMPLGGGGGGARVLQSAGHTLRDSTVKALNEYFGLNASREMWGRAVESLKADHSMPWNYHGKIMSNGNYLDKQGNFLDNIRDYLPF